MALRHQGARRLQRQSYLTSTAAATLSGSGTTAVYAFAPSFNTGAIDTALPTDTKLVEGALEIEITVGAQVTSTVALPCVIDNDYNQGGESPTTSGALAYPATYLSTFTAYTGGGALALDSLAITTADVGRIFSLIGSADPAFPEAVISFWRVYAGTDAAVAGAVVRATNYTGAGVYACVFRRVG